MEAGEWTKVCCSKQHEGWELDSHGRPGVQATFITCFEIVESRFIVGLISKQVWV